MQVAQLLGFRDVRLADVASVVFAIGLLAWCCGEEVMGQLPAGTRELKGQTEVQGYRIELKGIGELDGSAGVVKLRSDFMKGMFGGNGGRNVGGVAGDVGRGRAFRMPNQGIALKVTDLEGGKGKEKDLLFEIGSVYEIIEFNGTVSESKDMGPMVRSWPRFEKEFPECSAMYVYRQRGFDADFREISGELRVTQGRRLVAEFEVGQSKPDRKNAARKRAGQQNEAKRGVMQTKRVDGQEFVLESIEMDREGVLVTVGFPVPKKMEQLDDPVALMQLLNQGGRELELVDSEGELLVPVGSSIGGTSGGMGGSPGGGLSDGSSGSFGGGGVNAVSGGFSFSGGTGQGFSFQSNFQGQMQGQDVMGLDGIGSRVTFRFGPLPKGRKIELVRAIKVERDGEPQVVPFTIAPQ